MENKELENLDAEVQDVDGANNDNNASVTEDLISKKAFEDQKKRAEKLEAELKELRANAQKTPADEKPAEKHITSDREESFLVSVFGAKQLGYDEINTYLDKAKKIAQVEGIPLTKAIETDYFKSFDKEYQANKKSQEAQLNASKGSGFTGSKKTLATPGLSDDEFSQMLKAKIFGQN